VEEEKRERKKKIVSSFFFFFFFVVVVEEQGLAANIRCNTYHFLVKERWRFPAQQRCEHRTRKKKKKKKIKQKKKVDGTSATAANDAKPFQKCQRYLSKHNNSKQKIHGGHTFFAMRIDAVRERVSFRDCIFGEFDD
jgi:hypothetical protein